MKKVIILALAAFSATAFAQSSIQIKHMDSNTILAANAEVLTTTVAEENTKVNFDIKNTSTTETHYYLAKRYNVTLNAGATAYFCFAGNCYGDQTFVSPESLTLTPGQSASEIAGSFNNLTADLDEGTVVGLSIIKYSFINQDNPSDSIQVTVKYNSQPVGIKEHNKSISSFQVFPNPAKEKVSVLFQSPGTFESQLVVFNSIGEVVITKEITVQEGKNKIDFNVESLPAGVYFANVKAGNSSISKRLIVN